MRKLISRVIPLALLLFSAVSVVMTAFSWQLALCALVMVAVPASILLCKEDALLSQRFIWVIVAGLLIKLLLPVFPFRLEQWTLALTRTFIWDAYINVSPAALPLLVVLLFLQLTLRKKENFLLIVLRYCVLYFVLLFWSKSVLRFGASYNELILCLTAGFMMRELLALRKPEATAGMMPCILLIALFLYLPCLLGYQITEIISGYFLQTDATWLRNLLLVFGIAVLFWVDAFTRFSDSHPEHTAERQQAEGLITWGILYLLMRCWNNMLNYEVLYLFFPVAYPWLVKILDKKKIPAPALWGMAICILLALAKCFNLEICAGIALVGYFIVVPLFWGKQNTIGLELFALFLGIGGVCTLFSLNLGPIADLTIAPMYLLSLVLICTIWWLITWHIKKLNHMASDTFLSEFAPLRSWELPLALIPIVLTILKVLFVL